MSEQTVWDDPDYREGEELIDAPTPPLGFRICPCCGGSIAEGQRPPIYWRALQRHIATLEKAQDELLDMIAELVNQACIHSDSDATQITHAFLSTYEDAFTLLEKYGRLRYQDKARYWARLLTTEEVKR